jgi:hypothetical protein
MFISPRFIFSILLTGSLVSLGHAQAPLPLDPLTAQERALADTIARSDPRVRELLQSGQAELAHIEFVAMKSGADTSAGVDVPLRRHAQVIFLLGRTNEGLAILVDLERRTVVEVARSPGESVPLSLAEVERAARLTVAHPGVARLFGDRLPPFRIEGLREGRDTASTRIEAIRTTGPPGDTCYRRRCVVVFFRVNNRYVHVNRVLVDLLSNRVILREAVR